MERELKSPTFDKIEELASVLGMHPLSLLTFTYMQAQSGQSIDDLLEKVRKEIKAI